MNPHNTTSPNPQATPETPEVKSYLFRLDEIFYLTPTVRSFLLESICLRLDLQVYARHGLHLILEDDGAGNLQGHCPFCSGEASLLLNKRSGAYACLRCKKSGDLFSLTNECSLTPSTVMNDAAIYLSAYVEVAEQRKAASKEAV